MSGYSKLPFDYIERTIDILKGYHGKFNATMLINSATSLLTFINENYKQQMRLASNSMTVDMWGLSLSKITRCGIIRHANGCFCAQTPTINIVVRHIRNSLAHGNFEQIVNSNQKIICFILKDYDEFASAIDKQTFEISVSLSELKNFLLAMSTYICNNNMQRP